MKLAMAVLLFVGSAFGNSVSTIGISGIGSWMGYGDFESSNFGARHTPNFLLEGASDGKTLTGGLSFAMGQAEYRLALPQATLANGLLTGDFSGYEYLRLGPQDWVRYFLTGTFTEGVSFSAADQQGTVNIEQATFLGPVAMAPEPSTWVLMGLGGGLLLLRRLSIP